MQNLGTMRRETAARWQALLAETARREHLLVDALMRHVEGGSRHYGGLVEADDFRASSVDAFRHLLGRLADGSPPADLEDLPRRIGIRRAAQGVPLESLMATVREDFGVLWSTLLWIAGAADMPVLVSHVSELWWAVDDFATDVGVSYLRESAARTELDRSRQRAMVSALVSTPEPAPGLLRRIASTLDVDPDGAFEIVAADPADREQLDTAVARLVGRRGFVTDFEDAVVAFWDATVEPGPSLVGLRCGRPPTASGLAEVPAQVRTALRILRASPAHAQGPSTMADVWDRLAVEHLRAASPAFVGAMVTPLADCPPDERERIVTTVLAFFASGSIATTSADVFCHRNTVLNRLRRFRELTGLDPAVPRDAALAIVLLASF